MANRFTPRIKSGEIESVESLKAEFRALAKELHPDLAGPGAAEAFLRARAEYDAALRDFERHRFGFRAAGRDGRRPRAAAGPLAVFAALRMLRKRGFPKRPRHEKETLRYDYARWRFLAALRDTLEAGTGGGLAAAIEGGPGAAEGLAAFEEAFLGLREADAPKAAALLGFLDELEDYAARELPVMRTALVLELGALRGDESLSPALQSLLEILAGLLGLGAELGRPGRAAVDPGLTNR